FLFTYYQVVDDALLNCFGEAIRRKVLQLSHRMRMFSPAASVGQGTYEPSTFNM
ncbi:hypothetical protein ACLOJK_019129, partial [Asimina triloba]